MKFLGRVLNGTVQARATSFPGHSPNIQFWGKRQRYANEKLAVREGMPELRVLLELPKHLRNVPNCVSRLAYSPVFHVPARSRFTCTVGFTFSSQLLGSFNP